MPPDSPSGARAAAPGVRRAPLSQALPLWAVMRPAGRRGTQVTTSRSAPTNSARTGAHAVPGGRRRAAAAAVLEVGEVRDRAQVFLNRQPVGVLARDHHDRALPLPSGARGTLELLVEDQGRVDYGPRIGEPKGLIGPVTLDGEPVRGWRVMPLPLDRRRRPSPPRCVPGRPPIRSPRCAGPVFARAGLRPAGRARPTCSSARPAWARASPGSTGSALAGTGRADRSERCTCRGRSPGKMGTS